MPLQASLSFIFTFLILTLTAAPSEFWTETDLQKLKADRSNSLQITAEGATYYSLKFEDIYEVISNGGVGTVLDIPLGNGEFERFTLLGNSSMHPNLAARFPEIKTFNIVSATNPGTWGKLDISPQGVRIMIGVAGSKTVFIDPAFRNDTEAYIVYTRDMYVATKEATCLVSGEAGKYSTEDAKSAASFNDCELKTYRLAVAATGEYTQFHGGTVAQALAAMVTSVNRVNMVYELDFGVTLELIENTDDIIYTNFSTDPYTNGSPGDMIVENQTNINNVIGFSNYDIGHVFGTNSGGLAGLGVVCGGSKARGVTGSGAPIGDSFDIDYVAHEMGHQFGATHTFNNSCGGNRTNSTAVEPGSGSTIMAYAGICNPNIQNNSDDYFHGTSMRQIGLEIESHNNCPVITGIDNVAPQITSVTTDIFIPASTPFALTAQASDMDEDDVLTYCWEQMDTDISEQPPLASSDEGPNFRSFDPELSPTRYFPRLSALASSPSQTWERLPGVSRIMEFRVSVRDNAVGAGCTQYEDAEVTVVGEAGPFRVSYPSVTGIEWDAFTTETVLWDVASTDLAPINCELVDIYLSVDGGDSYPIVLVENVPNTGSAQISVPNNFTNDARVMVMNDAGTFFDISNNDFSINGISEGFYFTNTTPIINSCIGEEVVFNFGAEGVGDFSESIELSIQNPPVGVITTFGSNTILPGESTTLTLSNTSGVEVGVIDLIVEGMANGAENTLSLQAAFDAEDATDPELVFPADASEYVATEVDFSWSEAQSLNATYLLQLSLNADFTSLVIDSTGIGANSLSITGLVPETEYFWRVRKTTPCGDSEFSETFSFTTHTCFNFESVDVPKNISSNVSLVVSEIDILSSGILTDVNVVNISGTHLRMSDLAFKLVSPQGTEIDLVSNVCGDDEDFNFGFDDSADEQSVDCPPTSGLTYVPEGSLSDFIGEDSQGIWQLRILDQMPGSGGSLTNWSLELCIASETSFLLSTNESVVNVCQSNEATVGITALPVFEFTDPIALSASNLPEGVSIAFNPDTILSNESSSAIITAGATATAGSSPILITGISGDIVFDLELNLAINELEPAASDLLMPENQSVEVPSIVNFEWGESASPSANYTLEIALDAAFTDPFATIEEIATPFYIYPGLPPVETFFWRVRTDNGCEEATSAVFSFTTAACSFDSADDLPTNISSVPNTYFSDIEVPFSGNITSVRVSGLSGTHTRVSDLSARLISPLGTEVELFSNVCGSDEDFNLSFADGGQSEIDCPPTTGLEYAPAELLEAFAGEDANGIWTLELEDSELTGGGTFESWSLEICFVDNVFGVSDANHYNLSIFPNPTSGIVRIGMGEASDLDFIRVYDVSGRLLESVSVQGSEWLDLDLTPYASGIYFVRAIGQKGSSSFKLIKEN